MIIKTFRDVEAELRKLKTAMESLQRYRTLDEKSALDRATVSAMIMAALKGLRPAEGLNVAGTFSGPYSNPGVGRTTVVEYTLTANFTIPSPYIPTDRDVLTIFVKQGTGPYTIAFDSQFAVGVNTNLPGENLVTTVFSFRGRVDGLWWLTSMPVIIQ